MRGRINGRALPVAPPALRTDLQTFIDNLKASPLVDDVVLRNVTADPKGPAFGQRFDAWFSVVITPESLLQKLIVSPEPLDMDWSSP